MPNESQIDRIEQQLDDIARLGGKAERTAIFTNVTVIDANPAGLANRVIIQDPRDGDYIPALTIPGIVYNNNDLVNVLFLEGTEPLAFQQGSGSSTATGLWQLEGGTGPDIYYDQGNVAISDDLEHHGDADTLLSFTDDLVELQAGGVVMVRLTETVQDLIELGDVAGTGDVDINISAGQVFVRGSDGYTGIATSAPQKLLQVGAGTDAPTLSYEGIYVAINGIAQVAIRNNTDNVEGGIFAHTATIYIGSWTNHPIIFDTNNADRFEINAAGHKILKSTLPLRGESSNFPDIGSTTLAEKLGNVYLGTDKDFYPADDEAGLFQRDPNHYFTSITTHFNDFTGWTWAAYAGFVTPANIDVSTYGSLAAIFNSAAQGNARAFAYRSSYSSDIRARLSPPPVDVRTGIRMDDGTNNNYIELWAEGLSGGLFRAQYRYAIGGVVTGPTTLWGGSTFPLQWIGFRLLRSGDNVFMYYHIDTLSELFFTNVAITGWSPTRSGIVYDHYTGATFNSSRQSLYDWYKQ